MIKRTIEVSQDGYLRLSKNQFIIERGGVQIASVPIEDIGVLLLAHPQITLTHKLIQACLEKNVVIVHCDSRFMPIGLSQPLFAHTLHAKILQHQVALKKTRQKQLWQQIVKQKIIEQAETLKRGQIKHDAVLNKASRVQSGDKNNHEAQAAQIYWPLLMGQGFRRDPKEEGINVLLNYGYAIMRAMMARALVATGFHPALGINHSNQYNAYALADDVMEIYRPWVDEKVFVLAQQTNELQLNQASKAILLGMLSETVIFLDKKMPLMVAAGQWASHFKAAYQNDDKLSFPERLDREEV